VTCTLAALATGVFLRAGREGQHAILRPASETPRTKIWIYGFRTDQHFTRKTRPLKGADPDDFLTGRSANPSEGFRSFDYEELVKPR